MGGDQHPHFDFPQAHRDPAGQHVVALAWTMALVCILIAAVMVAITVGATNG